MATYSENDSTTLNMSDTSCQSSRSMIYFQPQTLSLIYYVLSHARHALFGFVERKKKGRAQRHIAHLESRRQLKPDISATSYFTANLLRLQGGY